MLPNVPDRSGDRSHSLFSLPNRRNGHLRLQFELSGLFGICGVQRSWRRGRYPV